MKIIIIRFSSIGDIVLTTPVIRGIRNKYPEATIHYLTKPAFESLVKYNPYLDEVILLQENLKDTLQAIKSQDYDHIIDLHNSLRTQVVKLGNFSKTHSFDKLSFKKWLYVKLKWNTLPSMHVVDRYLDTVRFLNIENDKEGLDFFIPAGKIVDFEKLNIPLKTKEYVAIAIGAAHVTKSIPVSLLVKIIDALDYPIVLIGGKEDTTKANEILAQTTNSKVYNAVGQYDILQSASFIKQAKALLTPDTGMMHIAAALRIPIVAVWGNTTPSLGMYPYTFHSEYTNIEVPTLPCRPCSHIGYTVCPKEHFHCMNKQDSTAIIHKINQYIR